MSLGGPRSGIAVALVGALLLGGCFGEMAGRDALAEGTNGGMGGVGEGDGGSDARAGTGGAVDNSVSSPPTACGDSPWVTLEGAVNTRALEGLVLGPGVTLACDQLYRGGQLTALSAEGCRQFAALGVKTVIDLRVPSEQTVRAPACVSEQGSVIAAPMPIPYYVSPADYLADLYATESVVTAMSVLGNADLYPVFFHCRHGRDRTGVLAAIILLALGATREQVLSEYLLTQETGADVFPESVSAVLDEIERIGGIDGYFELMGIDAGLVTAMRALLISQSGL